MSLAVNYNTHTDTNQVVAFFVWILTSFYSGKIIYFRKFAHAFTFTNMKLKKNSEAKERNVVVFIGNSRS